MTVYNNDMTAHVWAQQRKAEGRSHNGNMWFEGRTIYSYGVHYPLATFAPDGSLFLNADSSSMTTQGKHKPAVSRAVNYKGWRVPALDELLHAIANTDEKGRLKPDGKGWEGRFLSYLKTHWQAFPDDSDAAAWLLRASGSRGTWQAMRGKLENAKAKADAVSAKALARLQVTQAKELAARPVAGTVAQMQGIAAGASDWSRERDLKSHVKWLREIHRGSPAGKVRAACWLHVKASVAQAERLTGASSPRFRTIRQALAILRRFRLGDFGKAETAHALLNHALHERNALEALKSAHMPPAYRLAIIPRVNALGVTIAELEAERERERHAAQQAEREEWLAGESNRRAYHLQDERGGALVRAIDPVIDGCNVISGTLETSQGATVPLRHAVRAFGIVRACRNAGVEWRPEQPRADTFAIPSRIAVGHFRIDHISATGDFTAGCHRFHWPEIERLARQLGVWACVPDTLAALDIEESD